MSILYLARHGETDLNDYNRRAEDQMLGGQLNVQLNPRGRRQGDELGHLFLARGVTFDAAWSSDLDRCVETAERIVAPQPHVVPATDPRLRERSLGAFEGKTVSQIRMLFPEYASGDKADFRASYEHRAPGGEHYGDVEERMTAAIAEFEEGEGNILVVSHKHAIRAWLRKALGLSRPQALSLSIPNARPIVLAKEETYRLIEGLDLPI